LKIAIISSSVREGRESHKAALAVFRALQGRPEVEPVLIDLKELDLPPLSYVRDKFPDLPSNVGQVGQLLDSADGMLFVSPEYNGGYSSALKNAVDFYPKSTYQRKPIGVVTVSSGSMGGMRAAQQLQHLVLALWAIPSPQLLLVPNVQDRLDEQGEYIDASFRSKVESFIDHYLWLASRLTDQPVASS